MIYEQESQPSCLKLKALLAPHTNFKNTVAYSTVQSERFRKKNRGSLWHLERVFVDVSVRVPGATSADYPLSLSQTLTLEALIEAWQPASVKVAPGLQ